MAKVGIVIVSHSAKVAEGTLDMVRQMVGGDVPAAAAGGDPAGGLGCDIARIAQALDAAWSEAGVAVLFDLGSAETHAEMVIEMLPAERRARVVICQAPLVEGAVLAATESSGGSDLAAVKRAAERAAEPVTAGAADGALTGAVVLTNAVGLHARPAVKFTQLAKSFAADIEVATASNGPWTDAKSPVKVMRVKAGQGATLHLRARGADAAAALAAMIALCERRFDEG